MFLPVVPHMYQLCVLVKYFHRRFQRRPLGFWFHWVERRIWLFPEVLPKNQGELFKKHGASLDKVSLIATDGAPATFGKKRSLVTVVKIAAPYMDAIHHFIRLSGACEAWLSDQRRRTQQWRLLTSTRHAMNRMHVQRGFFSTHIQSSLNIIGAGYGSEVWCLWE